MRHTPKAADLYTAAIKNNALTEGVEISASFTDKQYNILTWGTGGRALYQIRTPYGGGEVYERLRDIYDYFDNC